MLKWVLVLIIVVFVLGYIQSRNTKKEKERRDGDFIGCGGGCSSCTNKGLCLKNQNNEKKQENRR